MWHLALCPHVAVPVCMSVSHEKNIGSGWLRPTLMTSFYVPLLRRDPVSKYSPAPRPGGEDSTRELGSRSSAPDGGPFLATCLPAARSCRGQ